MTAVPRNERIDAAHLVRSTRKLLRALFVTNSRRSPSGN